MKTKGFIIHDAGDSSVGIFSATWELKGDFYFSDEEELNDFKTDLEYVFTEYTGGFKISVMTEEEHEAYCKTENEFMMGL